MSPTSGPGRFWRAEDTWAVLLGFAGVAAVFSGAVASLPRPGRWTANPLAALPPELWLPLLGLLLGLGGATALALRAMGETRPGRQLAGFAALFALATLAHLLAGQSGARAWGLGYALFAVALGLLISNTSGTPAWLSTSARSELFIKTGLVLLGAEIVFSRMLTLGAPGLVVAWGVTPLVIITMYAFGVRVLRMPSRALVMVIATATSVCGVSAAIAAAAACRARREELTLAVAITMAFTVLMMVAMPAASRALGLGELVGGAWLGGTIDSTGAVVAAGAVLGPQAETVAAVVKMIQNILIGGVAFAIALYWVTVVERSPQAARPDPREIWRRFPKFILGFVGASLLTSFVLLPALGSESVEASLAVTKGLRGWLFCLAFLSIGLESDFRELARPLAGGKPLLLYVAGQGFNILLTLLAAWLAFGGVLFALPD